MKGGKSASAAAGEKTGGIQVIARAAAILRVLGGHPQGLSLGAIAQQCGLPRSTVQRIVDALAAEEFVHVSGEAGGVRLGPELGRLFFQTQYDLISVVRPLLENLCSELRESVVLSGREKDKVIVLDRIVAERTLRVVFPMGLLRAAIHSNAGGRALLANMRDEEVKTLLPSDMAATDKLSALLTELAEIRKTGIAIVFHEQEDLAEVAVATDTWFGQFAISVVAPRSRTRLDVIGPALLRCRDAVESQFSARRPDATPYTRDKQSRVE